jgi:hypothetical protein
VLVLGGRLRTFSQAYRAACVTSVLSLRVVGEVYGTRNDQAGKSTAQPGNA